MNCNQRSVNYSRNSKNSLNIAVFEIPYNFPPQLDFKGFTLCFPLVVKPLMVSFNEWQFLFIFKGVYVVPRIPKGILGDF